MSHLRQISPWTRAMIAIAALSVTAIAVIALAPAGSAGAKDTSPSQAQGDVAVAPGPPDPAVIEDFKNCMSDHGVDVPVPGEPFDGPREVHKPSAEEQQAFEACQEELPRPPHDVMMVPPPMDGKTADKLRECAKAQGIDLPARPPRPPAPDSSNDD